MTDEQENAREGELIDLGAATVETRGVGGTIVPDSLQPRAQAGILAD